MFFVYLLLWLIFSMRLSVEITVAGIIVSAVVYRFACVHMRYKHKTNFKIIRRLFLGIRYALVLLWETVKANIAVFRIVFRKTIKIEPRIIYFRTDLKTKAARVAFANSITLMPGSVVVALEDDLYCVHCLDGKFVEGIKDSVFIRLLRKIEE